MYGRNIHISASAIKTIFIKSYEETLFPKKIIGAGGSIYIERNFEMINNSRFCIVYFDEQNMSERRKSGTGIALDYAVKKGKRIIKLSILKKNYNGLSTTFPNL